MGRYSFVKRHPFELALAVIFLVLAIFGIFHHELWVDEARPWQIAKFTDWGSLAYIAKLESHPVLWYALVKILTNFFDNPIAIQLLSLIFGFGAFLTILFYSPFSRLEKLLLTTNLYLFFEYTLVARNYSLEIASLFVLCALFSHRRQHLAAYLLVCGILAQSHFYGFLWSALFLALLFFEGRPRLEDFKKKSIGLASIFYLICAGATVWVLLRDTEQVLLAHTFDFVTSLNWIPIGKTLLLGLFPAINPEEIFVTAKTPTTWFDPYGAALFLIVLGSIIYLLRKNRLALFMFASMTAIFIVFSVFRQNEALPPRHMGQLMLIVLVTLWIGNVSLRSRALKAVIVLMLATQAFAGLYSFTQDYKRPFSNGKKLAEWLRTSDFPKDDIVADGSFFSASFLAYLYDTTTYNTVSAEKVHFWRINQDELRLIKVRPGPDGKPIIQTREDVILKVFKKVRCDKNAEPLFIANYPAHVFSWPEINLELLQEFTGSMRAKEDFYVYRIITDRARFCQIKI